MYILAKAPNAIVLEYYSFRVLSLCDESKCPLCLSAVDNEVHVVICCPAFGDLWYKFTESKYFINPCEFRLALLLATQNERFCIKHSVEGKPCYCEEFNCMLWTNIQARYYNSLLCIRFRFRLVDLQHSNVSNLITVCVLSYNVYVQMGLWSYWITF